MYRLTAKDSTNNISILNRSTETQANLDMAYSTTMTFGLRATSIDFGYLASYSFVAQIEIMSAYMVIDDCQTWVNETQNPSGPLPSTVPQNDLSGLHGTEYVDLDS